MRGLNGLPSMATSELVPSRPFAFYGRLLLVTDHGRHDLGPYRPLAKLNEFNPAGPVVNCGFPGCYGQGGPACSGTRPRLCGSPRTRRPAALP